MAERTTCYHVDATQNTGGGQLRYTHIYEKVLSDDGTSIEMEVCPACSESYVGSGYWKFVRIINHDTPGTKALAPVQCSSNRRVKLNHNNTEGAVSQALALAARSDFKPIMIPVPDYGSSVELIPQRKGYVRVVAQQSLLVDNLLYTHDGVMKLHSDSRWYFISAATVIPTLSPKKKEGLVNAIAEAVNAYMAANTGFMDVFDVIARKQEIADMEKRIVELERNARRCGEENGRLVNAAALQLQSQANFIRESAELRSKLNTLKVEDADDPDAASKATAIDGDSVVVVDAKVIS